MKECILCEKQNSVIWFGICLICHLKIDDAMGYCIAKNTHDDYVKGGKQS